MAEKSNFGLKKETAGAISYLLGPFSGLVFLVMGKGEFVRFHAMQSVIFSVAVFVLNTFLTLSVVFAFLVPLLVLMEFGLWLYLMYQAVGGKKWEIPFLGKMVYKFL